MKNLFFVVFAFVAITLASCGKDSCDANDVSDAVDRITAAATAYGENPSATNCEAYRDSLNDYINDLDGCDNVTQTAIDDFQTAVDALNCG